MLDCHTNLKGTVNSLASKVYHAALSALSLFIMIAASFLSLVLIWCIFLILMHYFDYNQFIRNMSSFLLVFSLIDSVQKFNFALVFSFLGYKTCSLAETYSAHILKHVRLILTKILVYVNA